MQFHVQKRFLIFSLRFRWVYCQLETLRPCLPPSVRRTLNELPETLDETYERILREIPKSNRIYAHRLLQCLTVAMRPLSVEELAEILAIEFATSEEIPKLNEGLRWEDQEQAVLSACSSLITVVEDDGRRIVQFSHFSVKEFLTSDRLAISKVDTSHFHHIDLEPAHTIMAQACLCVLLRLDSHINEANIESLPLARYAAMYFGNHAEFENVNVLSHIRSGIDDLLDADKPHFAAWLWVRGGHFEGHPERPEAPPLYYVAEFGFRSMVDYLISKHPEDLSARGPYGIPLHAALGWGHADVALLLLRHCVDVDIRGCDDRTPLHFAAGRGLPEVARILIERHADINARDSTGETPLLKLANFGPRDGHLDAAQLLLEHGADVHTQDDDHLTPLHGATYEGNVKVARLLLEHGANINAQNKKGQTPLHKTLIKLNDSFGDRYFDSIRLILEHGAGVDTLDNDQSTPLHIASQYGCVKAARLLLEHGASVHLQNNDGQTPLQVASKGGHEEVTRLLSEHLKSEERT